jgi:cytochrome c biogenesis protein
LEEKEKKDIFEIVWKFFASVKLAIFLLIILALSSIIGTIVEQQAEPAKNITLLAKFFGDAFAPTVYNIFAELGFMDMYGSWWFVTFLVLFSINLIVCSLDRFPKTLRLVKTPMRTLSESGIKSMPVKKELSIKTSLNTARDEFFNALTASGYRVHEASGKGSVQLYTQKGRFARLSVYVVHLSIVLIFLGALIGIRFGFKGYLNLPEGRASTVAYLSPDETIPLGFTIKCNWYDTQYYEGTDTPKEFQSEIVIIDGGREVLKKVIEVNGPLIYKGITFYQANYGMMENAAGYFILNISSGSGQENTLRLKYGDSFEIPGTGIKGTISDFSPALTRDRNTGALTTYSEMMVNPAVAIDFDIPGEKKFRGWILRRYPETGILPGGNSVKFVDFWGVEYTGLQVAKDPGVWLIYLASILMTIGLYICFFISHKKIWIQITNNGDHAGITVGGSSNRNRLAFENDIEKILSSASKAIEERSKK